MRIVGGAWRGRGLVAPPGQVTRPTADRVRQALFDMLLHAPWGGRTVIEGAVVLDVFAGTGALGLEALSRGAARACFIEQDAAALRALRANVAACRAEGRVEVVAGDVFSVFGGRRYERAKGPACPDLLSLRGTGTGYPARAAHDERGEMTAPASLVFFDPPYGQNLASRAFNHLTGVGFIGAGALIVAEVGRHEPWLREDKLLAERQRGAARVLTFRANPTSRIRPRFP